MLNSKLFGEDIRKNEKEIKEKIGVVLDDSFLSDYLTPKQINSIMKDIYLTWEESKYIELLKQFNLPLNKLIKEFSSGMKMKLKIVVAISHNPQILILDEPTSGLDPVVRNEILDIFRKYIEEDETRSILLSSHITTDLEHISDYIIFIEKGNIVFNMPTPELLENYGIIKCSKDDFLKIDSKDYIKYKKEKYQYEVLTNDKNNIIKKYNITIIDKPSIEEIMLFYIKGGKIIMIKGLIKKDLYNLGSYKSSLIIMIIFCAVAIIGTKAVIYGPIIICTMIGMIALSTFSYDEISKANKYILTLPTNRKELVKEKFILAIGATIFGGILGILITIVVTKIMNYIQPINTINLNYNDLLFSTIGGMFGISLIQAIQIPSIYKWGPEKGRIQMFILIFLLVVLISGIGFLIMKSNININLDIFENFMERFGMIFLVLLIGSDIYDRQ